MSGFVCHFTRWIEPQRDGVLGAGEREQLQAHLRQGCEHCQEQIQYLDWLRAQLQSYSPAIDELAVQRQRTPLLLQAAAARQSGLKRRQQGLGAMKGAAAAVAAIGLGILLLDRTLSVNVSRVRQQPAEVAAPPSAAGTQLSPALPAAPAPENIPAADDLVKRAPAPAPQARTRVVSRRSKAESPRVDSGAPKNAEALGSNTEDAMYLRVLDMLREQRPEAARGLAVRYLEAFPDGFRRDEIKRIAEGKH